MTRNIPGRLDFRELMPKPAPSFHDLDHAQQTAAIRSLAADGHGDHEIARRFGLHVEQVRRVLATVDDQAAAAHARRWARP